MYYPVIALFIACCSSSTILAQNRYDVVIHELMADPSPAVSLPGNEWIELKNTSAVAVNLLNWRIGDLTSQTGPLPNYILQPDSMVIVCATSALASMTAFGTAIPVSSFPSLDNDGDQVFLKSSTGKIIHSINYKTSWYKNELKKEGGWTLEMIDARNPCGGIDNWEASTHSSGGSPGKRNSVEAINPDTSPPKILYAYCPDSLSIALSFSEPLDSVTAASISNYVIDDGISISSVAVAPPLFSQVLLRSNTVLTNSRIYTLTLSNLRDCSGNLITSSNKIKFGIPVEAQSGDLAINEILFNPRSGGNDYVEILNTGTSILNASRIYIANRNSAGGISSISAISSSHRLIFPGDYFAITDDADILQLQYLVQEPGNVLQVSTPSWPDDAGTVILLNGQGDVVDEVNYKEEWQFKLIANPEGVALERINARGNSNDAGNWHSASSNAGYGTPTYKNSQAGTAPAGLGRIVTSPTTFSPDNDGFNDVLTLHYNMQEAGWLVTITIFDVAGRVVRNLVRNNLAGISGAWTWDGLDDKGQKLSAGIYIIYADIYNLEGKREKIKKVVVLARRLS